MFGEFFRSKCTFLQFSSIYLYIISHPVIFYFLAFHFMVLLVHVIISDSYFCSLYSLFLFFINCFVALLIRLLFLIYLSHFICIVMNFLLSFLLFCFLLCFLSFFIYFLLSLFLACLPAFSFCFFLSIYLPSYLSFFPPSFHLTFLPRLIPSCISYHILIQLLFQNLSFPLTCLFGKWIHPLVGTPMIKYRLGLIDLSYCVSFRFLLSIFLYMVLLFNYISTFSSVIF